MEIKSFRDLKVWQLGKELALQVYGLTAHFPKEEIYGITSQMRRAAVSVPANIAEGFNRRHSREFKRFLSIALGSVAELETLVELACEFKYVDRDQSDKLFELIDHEGKMLRALLQESQLTDYQFRATNHKPRATSHEPRATNNEYKKRQMDPPHGERARPDRTLRGRPGQGKRR